MRSRSCPPREGVLIALEMRDAERGFYERREITDQEARRCANIDIYTGQVLDQMAAHIGSRKAQEYANRHGSRKMRELDDFFRDK